MISRCNIYCIVSKLQFIPTSSVFRRQNILKKKLLEKMLTEPTFEFELSEPGPPSRRPTRTPTTG